MPSLTLPIVGAHFRPPAKAFVQSMAVGQPLALRREPSNPYDENAIQVIVVTAALDPCCHEELDTLARGFGHDLEGILGQEEWHLGYIPKEHAATLARTFDEHGKDVVGNFGYDAAGKPTVTFDPQVVYADEEG